MIESLVQHLGRSNATDLSVQPQWTGKLRDVRQLTQDLIRTLQYSVLVDNDPRSPTSLSLFFYSKLASHSVTGSPWNVHTCSMPSTPYVHGWPRLSTPGNAPFVWTRNGTNKPSRLSLVSTEGSIEMLADKLPTLMHWLQVADDKPGRKLTKAAGSWLA
jgi:hypothetical protein